MLSNSNVSYVQLASGDAVSAPPPAYVVPAAAPIPLFNANFITYLQEQFRRHTKQAGAFQNLIDTSLLVPIVNYMQDLLIDHTNRITGQRVAGASFDGLLTLFSQTESQFKTTYSSIMDKKLMQSTLNALNQLKQDAYNSIKASQKGFIDQRHAMIIDAKNHITVAERRKLHDACCILACVVWCPVEYLITVLNMMGCNDRGDCCKQECVPIPSTPGRYHIFAPCTSIRNFADDYCDQNVIIGREAPRVERML